MLHRPLEQGGHERTVFFRRQRAGHSGAQGHIPPEPSPVRPGRAQEPKGEGVQLLRHGGLGLQHPQELVHKVRLVAEEKLHLLQVGIALQEAVERKQAHSEEVPPRAQAPEVFGGADPREQSEAQLLWHAVLPDQVGAEGVRRLPRRRRDRGQSRYIETAPTTPGPAGPAGPAPGRLGRRLASERGLLGGALPPPPGRLS